MNGYKCFWKGKTCEVMAETTYKAQCLAAKLLNVKPNKQHEITVMLCEKAGEAVAHIPLM